MRGITALMVAAHRRHLGVVKYLADERGAAMDAKAVDGKTALMFAEQSGHRDVQKYLAGLAAAQSRQKAETRARELAEAEEPTRIAEAELLEDSAVLGDGGTAKPSRRRRKARQTKEQPDPILESLQRSMEASAREALDVNSGEPPEDTNRVLRDEPPPPTPEVEPLLRQLQEHAAEVDRLNAEVDSLKALLTSKDVEIIDLMKRNEEQYEMHVELQRNYELVSEWHDDLAQKGAAQLKLEQRKRIAAQHKSQVSSNYPAVAKAEEWLCSHQDKIPIMQHLEIPIFCLRWTQATINRRMTFGDGESIFKLVDQLERGDKKPADINQHLDVVQYQGNFLSLSNRRFAALIMYQSLHRDRVVKARCRICSSNTEEFDTKYSTASDGLGVDVRHGDAQHFGATLFQRGDYVMHELEQLQQRHPENDISAAIARIRTRSSATEPDGCSITLTQVSQPSLPRRIVRCRALNRLRNTTNTNGTAWHSLSLLAQGASRE